mgnify:CR=1 FL=1|tara:strand:- start:790 stop:1056 length:267 start_codon:yes stop_codon:yes gene_type:complete
MTKRKELDIQTAFNATLTQATKTMIPGFHIDHSEFLELLENRGVSEEEFLAFPGKWKGVQVIEPLEKGGETYWVKEAVLLRLEEMNRG